MIHFLKGLFQNIYVPFLIFLIKCILYIRSYFLYSCSMISINNLSLIFGDQSLYDNVSFNINHKDKIGLVGRNGSGKSTFFSLLTGELEPDDGKIAIPKHYRMGIVKQTISFSKEFVLEEACLGLQPDDQYSEWKVEKLLLGLGFSDEDMYRDPNEFSGGYQVRLNLVKVLASEPDMLLLDEPTNYLDIGSVRWLQKFLKQWPGELIIISHDRGFMDSVTNHTMAIHRTKVKKIKGSTLDIYTKIEEEEIIYEKTRANQEKQQQKVQKFIDTFRSKANLAKLVQSRIKALNRAEKLEKLSDIAMLDFSFNDADFHAKHLLNARNVSFAYPKGDPLFSGVSIDIEKNDRICIIGKNGVGKSTLLKTLYGVLTPTDGDISTHPVTKIGFFGQTNIDTLDPNHTIEEELTSAWGTGDREKVRKIAGTMMFSGDQALKPIRVLSGGEKSRVLLGKILLSPSNLLMLDEPTHHLDMESCDTLVQAIDQFKGAAIIVTHNETFLHMLARKLIIFDSNGASLFLGTYQDYLDKVGHL